MIPRVEVPETNVPVVAVVVNSIAVVSAPELIRTGLPFAFNSRRMNCELMDLISYVLPKLV